MSPNHIELLRRNSEYAVTHKPLPTISEIEAAGTVPPKTCIITCVDPRVFPEELLKLQIGEAFIFRTIGAHPQPVLENIVGLDRTSRGFENLIVMYHTDCGACRFDVPWIQSQLLNEFPTAKAEIDQMAFGEISTSLEDSLRADVEWVKAQPTCREQLAKAVRGFMYDIKTGRLREVA